MKEHPNFYENVKEAMMRLRRTVVVYDREPYVVITITNHKADGVFRIYLQPIAGDPAVPRVRPEPENFPPEHPGIGQYMDEWMVKNPNQGVIRKQMNSPLFNKFRPYPLGMCNTKSGVYYVERQPNRKTEQGLVSSMLYETPIMAAPSSTKASGRLDVYSEAFRACIVGEYPSAQECLANLSDPNIVNEAAAFHRDFALVRGPIGMLFLAYKHDVVAVLPKNNFEAVRMGREFPHTKEVIHDLGLFQTIV